MSRLIQADVFDGLENIEDGSISLIVTSPPYFNTKQYDGFESWETYDQYLEWTEDWIKHATQKLKEGRMFCINTSPVIVPREKRSERSKRYNIPADIHHIFESIGFWFIENITWAKPEGAAINRNQRFSLDRHPLQWKANPVTESILVYQKPTDKLNGELIKEQGGKGRIKGPFERSDLWFINPETDVNHPAPFPPTIPKKLIKYYTWEDDIVLDPFVGSGTTAFVAKQMSRKYIGIDKSEMYISHAEKRVESITSKSENDWWW